MNCYNSESFLDEAIKSVMSQTYKNFEIIFWDNASTDKSKEIASNYAPKLQYFYGKELVPLYAARNLALDKCNGDYVAFLDCDDIWMVDKLERQVKKILGGFHIVYGGYEIIDEKGDSKGIVEKDNISGNITNSLLRKNTISIGSILIKKTLLEVNKFDSYYDLLGDFDLWIRLSIENEIGSIEGIVEYSREHATNTSNNLKGKWLNERRRFYRKFLSSYNLFKYPVIIIYIIKAEIRGLFGAR